MAIVWIVTAGNSDVKLECDYGWGDLREKKNSQLKPCHKGFNSLIKGDDNLLFLPARTMGILYDDTWETHEKYFTFPLLERFIQKVQDEGKTPERIIVLLTNQEKIFLEDSDNFQYDRSESSPYWRDTCRLEPILKYYFDREFGRDKVKFSFPILEPETREKGLDNWDSTLELVQEEFKNWNISKDDSVIVSHQASTPAISSAVQFVSLANFGDKVEFLIANERDSNLTRFLEGSKYLKEIRKREAATLLSHPDYSGVHIILKSYLKNDDTEKLLNAAIQWNFAKFDEFAGELEKLLGQKYQNLVQQVKERKQHWWWTAYESAYLATIRLQQKNAVEAFFHSFRSVEGLLRQWIDKFYSEEIKITKHPKWEENERWNRNLNTYGEDLYWFLTLKKSVDQSKDIRQNKTPDIFIFGSQIFKKRNDLFHQLKGLQDKEEVFENWRSPNEKKWNHDPEGKWKMRILKCLNFIAEDDLPKEFESLEEASLMVKVHQELVSMIDDL